MPMTRQKASSLSRIVGFPICYLVLLCLCNARFVTSISFNADEIPSVEDVIKCPNPKEIDFATEIDVADPNVAREWNEVSGLGISPTQIAPSGAPVMWGHNDGRDRAEYGTNFAAWDPVTGERLMTFILPYNENSDPPLVNQDWEDMTIGSCGNTEETKGDTCIYLADLGDNYASDQINTSIRPAGRPYRIYKIKEPVLDSFARTATRIISYPVSVVTALEIDYLDASSPARTANSEGIFLDHTGWGKGGAVGDIYIVTKSRDYGRLYKVPANVWPSGEATNTKYSPKVVGSSYADGEFRRFLWTSASMSWDGTKIIMGTIHRNYVFLRCPGQTVAEAIVGRDACMIWENPPEAADNKKQFEAVAWYPDGKTVLNIAESITTVPRIVKVSLDYDFPAAYCPAVTFQNVGFTSSCQTIPTPYDDNDSFVSEKKPDDWCIESSAHFGSMAPSAAASGMPSLAPSVATAASSVSDRPSSTSSSPSTPPTPETTLATGSGTDCADDSTSDNINSSQTDASSGIIFFESTFLVGIVLLLSLSL